MMKRIVNPFVYQPILEHSMPNSTIPAWLSETYSQCYEDVIIDSLIRARVKRRGQPFSNIKYIEVGANHPVCTSATYFMQQKYGATGILVEANKDLIGSLKKFRPNDTIIYAAVFDEDVESTEFNISPENEVSSLVEGFPQNWKNGEVGIKSKVLVPVVRMNDLLGMVTGADMVFLSIDVEGFDMRLLKDIDFKKYRPSIIQVEPSDAFVPGTGDAMVELLTGKGYELVAETDVNLIFQNRVF